MKELRQRALDAYPRADSFVNVYFSGACLAYWRCASRATREGMMPGLILDAGSGRGGWRPFLEVAGVRVESLDIAARPDAALEWVADLTDMPQVPSDRFDCVVCHQVLEHVPRPNLAMAEISRVLKPGGRLILSVPHLSRLHELPHDYFRYTHRGLRILLEDANLEIETMRHYGGIATFTHHQLSTLILGFASLAGPVYPAFVAMMAPFSMLAAVFDKLLDPGGLAPNGYVVTARKRRSARAILRDPVG